MSELPPVVDLLAACERLDGPWQPRVVAALNDVRFKVARVEGTFPWHHHDDTDEAFWILEGEVQFDFPTGTRTATAGQLVVVPRGLEHRPRSEAGAKIVLIEPAGVVNTGNLEGDAHTSDVDVWLDGDGDATTR